MKIVSIGPASPLRGGIAKFNESFVLACIKKNFDAEIISYKFLYPSFLFPGKTQYSEDPAPDNLKITQAIHSVNPFNWGNVAKMINKISPDLVIIHYWMPFFAPALGTIARKIKASNRTVIIAVAHNLFPHESQPGIKLLTGFFLKPVDGFVGLSSSVLSDFRTFKMIKPAICLPHPVYDIYGHKPSREEALSFLKLDPGFRYLLFFGLIRKYKGLDLLLDAFSRLNVEKVKLIVAGEFYENKRGYFSMADTLGISDRVIFTDKFIPENEVRYYFSAADTVVQPYISATQSGVTQIAYHFDCPMVVSNVGGLPEIVFDGQTGFVCQRDPVEIALAIRKSLDLDTRKKLIEGIKREKYRFSWTTFVEKVIELYRLF